MPCSSAAAMLRITRIQGPFGPSLKLEGRFVGESASLLQAELAERRGGEPIVALDLAAVHFADKRAVRVLCAAHARGLRLYGCSPLLLLLLGGPQP